MMRVKFYNRDDLFSDKKKALSCLFNTYPQQSVFEGGVEYNITYSNEKGKPISKIKLSRTIILTPCKDSSENKGKHRAHIVREKAFYENEKSILFKIGFTSPPLDRRAIDRFKSIPESPKQRSKRTVKKIKCEGLNDRQNAFKTKTLSPSHLRLRTPVFSNGHTYFVMRHLGSIDLYSYLHSSIFKNSSLSDRLKLCLAINDAVKNQVHDNDLVHRDLKPSNIMLSETKPWIAHIVDFDDCKHVDTVDNSWPGTPLYGSPEAFHHENTTIKSDIYALGCIFADVLGSKRAYQSTSSEFDLTTELVFGRIETPGLLDFCKVTPDFKTGARLLIIHCCLRHPEKRPDYNEITRLLTDLLTQAQAIEIEQSSENTDTASHQVNRQR